MRTLFNSTRLGICIILLSLTTQVLHAQWLGSSELTHQDNVFTAFPSPTAASFAKMEEIPVDLYNGTSTVTIPLYTLNNGKMGLPFNLSYTSTGLRVQERASRVGLGWNISIGGVITREMRGMPDDSDTGNGFINTGSLLKGNIPDTSPGNSLNQAEKDLLNDIVDELYDSQPDRFILSTPTVGGEFFFVDGEPVFRSKQKVTIQEYYKTNSDVIDYWVITDASGIKYTFEQEETTSVTTTTVSNETIPDGENDPPVTEVDYTSAWYLTKIEHPQTSNDIILEYSGVGSSDQDIYNQSIIIYGTAIGGATYCNTVSNQYIDSRVYTEVDVPLPSKVKLQNDTDTYVEFVWSSRDDLTSEKRLSELKVYHHSNLVKKFSLTHGYYTNGTHKRLRLDEVTEEDGSSNTFPPYSFTYNTGSIPEYGSKEVDYWGYYNGQTGNYNYIPTVVYNNSTIFTGANQTPNSAYAKHGILTKIDYPTGGSASFQYEGNTYSYVNDVDQGSNSVAGGVRVSQISYADGSGSTIRTKKYVYERPDISGRSSGNLYAEPIFMESGSGMFYDGSNNNTCPYIKSSMTAAYQIADYNWDQFGYKTVSEWQSSDDRFGETIYNFEKNPNLDQGKLYETEILDNNGDTLSVKENDYVYTTESTWAQYATPLRSINVYPNGCPHSSGCIEADHDTTWVSNSGGRWVHYDYLDITTEKIYNGSSTGYVEITKEYDYDSNLQLSSLKETVEGYPTRTTTYTYSNVSYPYVTTLKEGTTTLSEIKNTWTSFSGNYLLNTSEVLRDGSYVTVVDPVSYDANGNMLEVKDAIGTSTAYVWNEEEMVPLGIFQNATPGNVYAHSFASDGLTNWVVVDINSDGDFEATAEDGKLKMTHYGAIASNSEFDRITYDHGSEITGSVVWEFDVKIADSDNYDLKMTAGGSSWTGTNGATTERSVWTAINNETWRYRNSEGWTDIEDLEIGETYAFKIVIHTSTSKVDYYINGELKASNVDTWFSTSGIQKITFGSYGHNNLTSEWFIDNVRLYPEDAKATTQEVDPTFITPLAMKDAAGSTSRFNYDDFGRLYQTFNPNGKLITSNEYVFSADRNSGSYVATDPNQVASITYIDHLFDSDFSNSSGWSSVNTTHNVFNVQMAGETTVRMGSGGSYEGMNVTSLGEDFITRIDFYPDNTTAGTPHIMLDASGNRFGVHYLHSSDSFRIQYRKSYGSWTYPFTFPLDAPIDTWYTIELQKVGSDLTAWVYPKGQGRDPDNSYTLGGFTSSWTPNFTLTGNDDYYYAANLHIAERWQSAVTYADGMGREIQTQVRGNSRVIATETLYNSRGLPYVTSRPIDTTATAFPGFYAQGLLSDGITFTPGLDIDEDSPVADYYEDYYTSSNDELYAYSYTTYESSPLSRVVTSTLPGEDYQTTSSQAVKTRYGLNSQSFTVNNKTWGSDSLIKTVTEDPSENEVITYTDGWGQTIVSGINMNPASDDELVPGSGDIITMYEYNLRGDLIWQEDPNGNESTYTYDETGQLLEKSLPDLDGNVNYAYDDKGRLRFTESPSHKQSGSSSTPANGSSGTVNFSISKIGILDFSVNATIQNEGPVYSYELSAESTPLFTATLDAWETTASGRMLVQEGSFQVKEELIESGSQQSSASHNATFTPLKYSYTKYDELDRPTEIGEYYGSTAFSSANPNSQTFPTSDNLTLVEYKYDEGITYTNANNTEGRVTEIWYYDPNDLDATPGKTFYSYNELGLVEWVAQRVIGLSGTHFIRYTYDELGQLKRVHYDSPNSGEDFYFWFDYDELGRLQYLRSNENSSESTAVQEAAYTYWADGQVKQLKLGPEGTPAQTVDYAYTIQGWLETINNGTVSTASGNNNDRFSMVLDHHEDGNVKTQTWRQSAISTTASTYNYKYDEASRLEEACYGDADCDNSSYDVDYVYDKNGNIDDIYRYSNTGTLDHINPVLASSSNRLQTIVRNGPGYTVSYDKRGNITENELQGIENISYDWRNLATWAVANGSALLYNYDGEGMRVVKEVVDGTKVYYIRDAAGQTIAAHDGSQLIYWVLPGGIGIINN